VGTRPRYARYMTRCCVIPTADNTPIRLTCIDPNRKCSIWAYDPMVV
jgi:hypothetical protein